ncbi:MAG: UDP-N-acetylmuramate dehydrogenase [Rikenellaceae bacterium]
MRIEYEIDIKHLNTFGISVKAHNYVEIDNFHDLRFFFKYNDNKEWFVIGGGSNILFTKDYEGTLLHIASKDIEVLESDDDKFVYVKSGAGVVWDEFVDYTIKNDYFGLENLSYIPGTVGASPVQNIGAYGVEAKDCIHEVEYFDVDSLEKETISGEDCEFDYRHSIFKTKLKSKAIVLSVTYKLSKVFTPNLSYGGLKQLFDDGSVFTASELREKIIEIRKTKLPNPDEIGNGGSFFKNPIVSTEKFDLLKHKYPEIPFYMVDNGVKIPAAWLIEKSGWKGRRIGDAGVHVNQALVLVNYGEATGNEVLEVSKAIQKDVLDKFGIEIFPEINIL